MRLIIIDDPEMLLGSFRSLTPVRGLTHGFYRYPARFSPQFAKAVILQFSKENDCVLDAFMGGGTAVVEAVASGRNALGIDVNPLSPFITNVKTTPLSDRDQEAIISWADKLDFENSWQGQLTSIDPRLKNMPNEARDTLAYAVSTASQLEFPRQRRFARCALLKLGQWAIDCRKDIPSANHMKAQFRKQVMDMMNGLNELVKNAKSNGIPKNKITGKRMLYLGTINEAVENRKFARVFPRPKLVLTSPPYPGVHVLYHRWQVDGRRETPAPYWLAGLEDGHGESYYTLGGRSISGLRNYFVKLTDTFGAIRQFIDPDGLVVQMVAFSDPNEQLPSFMNAMSLAGFEELNLFGDSCSGYQSREVPNRKWYAYGEKKQCASNEILLFHRPYR